MVSERKREGNSVYFEGAKASEKQVFEKILMSTSQGKSLKKSATSRQIQKSTKK